MPCSSPIDKYWLTHVTMERNTLDFVCVYVCIHIYICGMYMLCVNYTVSAKGESKNVGYFSTVQVFSQYAKEPWIHRNQMFCQGSPNKFVWDRGE